MQIITITGYKGGVSKSTKAIHLATYLSERGDTLLVDGDPNRTVISWGQRGKVPFTWLTDKSISNGANTSAMVRLSGDLSVSQPFYCRRRTTGD